jgi:hypothetical protein
MLSKKKGFPIGLYLMPRHRQWWRSLVPVTLSVSTQSEQVRYAQVVFGLAVDYQQESHADC